MKASSPPPCWPVLRHRRVLEPPVALFFNEPTLLPVLMPLAPAATLLARFPQQAQRRPDPVQGGVRDWLLDRLRR
jgi:hypothetical protein